MKISKRQLKKLINEALTAKNSDDEIAAAIAPLTKAKKYKEAAEILLPIFGWSDLPLMLDDSDLAYVFQEYGITRQDNRAIEEEAWEIERDRQNTLTSNDPDKDWLEFIGDHFISSITPEDLATLGWKEYKRYIRLAPPESISHGVGEIHITNDDIESYGPGTRDELIDFLTRRAPEGGLKKRKPRKRYPGPVYDHKKLSLTDLLFEEEEKPELTGDAGEDLETAFKAGPEGVRAFMDSNKDEAVTDILAKAAEEHDGSTEDDMITVGGATPKAVGDLGPTQQFIDLMQSVSFPLGSAEVLDGAISSKTSGAPGSISVSGNAILDGHHRWSGVFAITPDGAISSKDFGFPGGVSEKLAAAQMAVAAVKKGKGQPSKGGGAATDIIGKGKDEIVAMIDANKGKQTDKKAPGPLLNDKMIQSIANGDYPGINTWAGIPGDAKFVSLEESEAGFENDPIRKAIAEKIGGNLASLPQPLAGAPESREDMPQLDHEDIGGDTGLDKITKGLPAGEYNVVPPFAKKEESKMSKGNLVLERWQRLAGLNEGTLYIQRYESSDGFAAEDTSGEFITTGEMVKALLDAGHYDIFSRDAETSLQSLQDRSAKGVQGGIERWDSDVFPIYYNVNNEKVIELFAVLKGYEVEEVDDLPSDLVSYSDPRGSDYVETEDDREAAKAEFDFESYYS